MYGKNAEVTTSLGQFTDKVSLKNALEQIVIPSDGNRIERVLEKIHDEVFQIGTGYRQEIPKTILLFTTKRPEVNPGPAAQRLLRAGVKIVVVGVGVDLKLPDLHSITGGQDDHIVIIQDDDDLDIDIDVTRSKYSLSFYNCLKTVISYSIFDFSILSK